MGESPDRANATPPTGASSRNRPPRGAFLHEGRFNLALVYARSGNRAGAQEQAQELLRRLPPDAPQRAEVERLLRALQ